MMSVQRKKKLLLIHELTDETYSLVATLPAGDYGTEEVCGRSKNFLYRSNGNKADDRI